MQLINFHTEQPASQDVFPGGSHDKVATAINGHLLSAFPSKVVGLDGEFGSGKSSILHMLEAKLTAADPNHRVWFFDCEQNYQGSTKSNFIELFTDEVLKEVPHVSKKAQALKASRDKALGRLFEYTKKTTSRVSAWALALLASLFFAATSFREIFALTRSTQQAHTWLIAIHCFSLFSPVLILIAAKVWHWRVDVGGERWSLLSLFKGSTDDRINEKIEIGKEVTPLDLKKTLLEQLDVVSDKRFVIILDNLDRLPKDSLRSVWSDLEIFIEVAAKAANLTVVVPFCSTKVADYLKADGDRRYDAKDFIAKKFPVVFRAPPVITSGWKNGFRQLWRHTFSPAGESIVEQSAQLLQRHSPMANNLVTPRLQKKFINDIATTALVVGDQISLLAIAAHLLLCKYAEHSLPEILRVDGFSEEYQKTTGEPDTRLINDTKAQLSAVLGNTMETGWQIQFLQIHYLTTSDIAIAELIDTPLEEAFASEDHDALAKLTSLFGFSDAIKRLLSRRPVLASLLPTIAAAHQAHGGEWIEPLLEILNAEQLELFSEAYGGSDEFYEAVRYCKGVGFDGRLLMQHGADLEANLKKTLNTAYDDEMLELARLTLNAFDLYLYAQDFLFSGFVLSRAEILMHLLPDIEDLKVITAKDFKFDQTGFADANLQLVSCPDHALVTTSLPVASVIPALEWLYAERKLGGGLSGGIKAPEVAALAKFTGAAGEVDNAVVALALAATVDQAVTGAVALLLTNTNSSLIKAVAAITYLRQFDVDSLANLEDLDDILKSSEFRSLANATLYTASLFDVLADEQVGESIAGYLAELIREDRILKLKTEWVVKNFSILAQSLKPYGLSEDDLLAWLAAWDKWIKENTEDVLNADGHLIQCVLNSSPEVLPMTRACVIEQVTTNERSRDEWMQIIYAGENRHLAIVEAVNREGLSISSIGAVEDALVEVLTNVANAAVPAPLGQAQYNLMDALLACVEVQQRSVIGIRLRMMLFSDVVEPDRLQTPLARYGHLIPSIQPSSPQEVLRIVLLLSYLSRSADSGSKLAAFFDSRADQIAAYKFSQELKKAIGEAVARLSDITPALYRKFAKAKGFVRMLQAFKRAPKDDNVD